jgi:hypothetical protein
LAPFARIGRNQEAQGVDRAAPRLLHHPQSPLVQCSNIQVSESKTQRACLVSVARPTDSLPSSAQRRTALVSSTTQGPGQPASARLTLTPDTSADIRTLADPPRAVGRGRIRPIPKRADEISRRVCDIRGSAHDTAAIPNRILPFLAFDFLGIGLRLAQSRTGVGANMGDRGFPTSSQGGGRVEMLFGRDGHGRVGFGQFGGEHGARRGVGMVGRRGSVGRRGARVRRSRGIVVGKRCGRGILDRSECYLLVRTKKESKAQDEMVGYHKTGDILTNERNGWRNQGIRSSLGQSEQIPWATTGNAPEETSAGSACCSALARTAHPRPSPAPWTLAPASQSRERCWARWPARLSDWGLAGT